MVLIRHDLPENVLRLMTFPSTHQSPITVNRKANVLTIGTVKLNSIDHVSMLVEDSQ